MTIKVSDVNDNAPSFQRPFYSATLSDVAVANLTVFQLIAVDPDIGPGGQLKYSIKSGNTGGAFIIEKYSGILLRSIMCIVDHNILNLEKYLHSSSGRPSTILRRLQIFDSSNIWKKGNRFLRGAAVGV